MVNSSIFNKNEYFFNGFWILKMIIKRIYETLQLRGKTNFCKLLLYQVCLKNCISGKKYAYKKTIIFLLSGLIERSSNFKKNIKH